MKSKIIRNAASSRNNKTTPTLTSDWKTIFQSRLGNAAVIFAAAFLFVTESADAQSKSTQPQFQSSPRGSIMLSRDVKLGAKNDPASVKKEAGSPNVAPGHRLAPPPIVYVDDDWVGTTPGDDPDGAGPATNFGYDSFATIQDGINGVAAPGNVIVYAGTYDEDVAANKADVTLFGTDGPSVTTIRGLFRRRWLRPSM